MSKVYGQCDLCDNVATGEILDSYMIEKLNVCDDCFKEVFLDVSDEGKDYFYAWASEMYGRERANYLTESIYGSSVDEEDEFIDDGETMTMFTYGILKYRDNLEREGATNIVENSIIKGHKIHLYSNSFPITQKTDNENDIVYGTLFEIPKYYVLSNYDYIEGYNPNRPAHNNMYNREVVQVTKPNGEVVEAEMYYANQIQFEHHLNDFTHIPTGNFDDKHLAKSFGYYARQDKKKRGRK